MNSSEITSRSITQMSIPLADVEEKADGWTLSCDFLQNISTKSKAYGGFEPSLEETESVLLALLDFEAFEDVEKDPGE